MKGHPISYSKAEMRFLEARRLLPIAEYHAAFVARFARADVTAGHLHALRKRKGWKTGRTGFFVKGEAPHNKGAPCRPGTGGRHPNAVATQFRKGVRQGVAVKLWKPIGTERRSKDGYLERKIHNGMPLQSRWRAVHILNWEAVNGPLPKGMALKCLDGNKENRDPSNFEPVSRAVLARLNGGRWKTRIAYDAAPAEVKPTVLALAKLEQQIHERTKP